MSSKNRFHVSGLALVLVLVLSLLAGCAMPSFMQPKKPAKPAAPQPKTVALVVPAGRAAGVVSALTGGAKVAAGEQPASAPVALRVIPTQGDWLAQLANLPAGSVIGGPISEASYRKMKAAGIMDSYVVFAFLPEIDSGDEGVNAWRFFPSMSDQIDAVTELAVRRLDIRTMASFGGSDNYSKKATDLLEQKLASENVILQRVAADPDPSRWTEQVKPLVNPETDEVTGALIPHTPFEAVFLPGSWKHLNSVFTAFGSNGEDRLVLLGTMIWDGYNNRGTQNASQYALVAYPTAFVRSRAPQSLTKTPHATFWGALGYDFVRFASRLNIKGRPDSSTVNAQARQAALMNFVMAPVSYDSRGRATQNLFMVQPGLAGPEMVDLNTLRANRAQAIQRVEERRLNATDPALAEEKPSDPGVRTAPGLPSRPAGPIMRTTPHSSHKLSLPGTR